MILTGRKTKGEYMKNEKDNAKLRPWSCTLGQMKDAMLAYAQATNASALKRVTKNVIDRMNAIKEAEAIAQAERR
jgi:hypothetical protein